MRIDGTTVLLGLIGNPITHSYSPLLHNAVLDHLGLNAVYVPLQYSHQYLQEAVTALRCSNFKGVNVTIPFKEAVVPYLDELSGDAADCGAVNVIQHDHGRLIGHNTDGQGFLAALRAARVPIRGRVLFIGAGGAARSLGFALARAGVSEITLLDTNRERAHNLAQLIEERTTCSSTGNLMQREHFKEAAVNADLIVNCSPVGMHPHVDESPVDALDFVPRDTVLCDLVYNPTCTRFLAMGQQHGFQVLNGLAMFIHQAALTMQILLGIDPPLEFMEEVMSGEVL
ncbi:MAG TPA: shikimate dehydrogenase [Syntrophomonadaceae bacterium]|nr:shikimate dehydrogenase [Syntrophomonadaceae bacterium]